MKMIDPNITRPRTKPAALASANVALRNSRSGRIGSRVRASWTTNSTPSTTPAANRPTITPEPQAYSAPPQLSASSRQLTPATSSAAPIQSTVCSRRSNGTSRITCQQTTMARIASGTLM